MISRIEFKKTVREVAPGDREFYSFVVGRAQANGHANFPVYLYAIRRHVAIQTQQYRKVRIHELDSFTLTMLADYVWERKAPCKGIVTKDRHGIFKPMVAEADKIAMQAFENFIDTEYPKMMEEAKRAIGRSVAIDLETAGLSDKPKVRLLDPTSYPTPTKNPCMEIEMPGHGSCPISPPGDDDPFNPGCDCGAKKAGTTHARWCSTMQVPRC
jgi:hypothetical protein